MLIGFIKQYYSVVNRYNSQTKFKEKLFECQILLLFTILPRRRHQPLHVRNSQTLPLLRQPSKVQFFQVHPWVLLRFSWARMSHCFHGKIHCLPCCCCRHSHHPNCCQTSRYPDLPRIHSLLLSPCYWRHLAKDWVRLNCYSRGRFRSLLHSFRPRNQIVGCCRSKVRAPVDLPCCVHLFGHRAPIKVQPLCQKKLQ